MAAISTPRMTLADALLKEGVIDRDQHDRALKEYDRTKTSLIRILTEMGAINDKTRLEILRRSTDCDMINLENVVPSADVAMGMTRDQCRRMHLVPLRIDGNSVCVAMEDPTDLRALETIEKIFGKPAKPLLATSKQIFETIERLPASEASQEAVELPRSWGYKFFAFLSLLFLTLAPMAIFYCSVILTNAGRKWYNGLAMSQFENALFFMVVWGSWAGVAYFLNDVIFGRKKS
ncbi:hypothetical protein IT570_02170 [Candidatus Sumerlaeota bacterium]|nr:hypothetical protein [Candidatus Sumerlaeota bacterium]